MSLAGLLARGKARHESLMSDTVTVTRGAGHAAGVYDSSTKTYTPQNGPTVYSGKARVILGQGSEQRAEDGATVEMPFVVEFPAGTVLERGDSITVTASTYATELVGLTVWVLDVDLDEWATATVTHCTDHQAEATA